MKDQDENLLGHGETANPDHFGNPDAPHHSEIAGAAAFPPAVWVEKDPLTGFATYPKRNQGLKSDCTCYAAGKLLAIDYLAKTGIWRELSPDTVYPYVCVPGGGANSLDVMNFSIKNGMGLDALYPSDSLTEAQAEDPAGIPSDNKIIGQIYRPAGVVQCAADFETIASILQAYQKQGIKKGVGISIIGQNNGTWYSSMPAPASAASPNPYWYHRVVITDFGLINGVKVLAIDNSAGTAVGNAGQQFLQVGFEPTIYGALYTTAPSSYDASAQPAWPRYAWNAVLQVGSSGPDVLALQQALQSLGMFPISSLVAPTGTYGGITKAGIMQFQGAFGMPQTGAVDAPTMQKLNSIFNV